MSSRKVLRMHARCRALIDFDGTIAPDDPTDHLFERFANPAWREVEGVWQAGQISSRECMGRQVAMLRATPAQLDEEISKVRIDPAFHTFLRFCARHGVEAMVVSDGFDRVVRAVLESARIAIPFFANQTPVASGRSLAPRVPSRAERLQGRERQLQVLARRGEPTSPDSGDR